MTYEHPGWLKILCCLMVLHWVLLTNCIAKIVLASSGYKPVLIVADFGSRRRVFYLH